MVSFFKNNVVTFLTKAVTNWVENEEYHYVLKQPKQYY